MICPKGYLNKVWIIENKKQNKRILPEKLPDIVISIISHNKFNNYLKTSSTPSLAELYYWLNVDSYIG